MKLTKRKPQSIVTLNLTPMIDIVFLLLIFFITITQVSQINSKQLELPQLEGSRDQQPSALIINVDDAGMIEISGQLRTLPEVVAMVGDELEAIGNPQLLTIEIRADRRGTSQTVNQVITRLARMGLAKVNVAVQTGG